MAVTISLAADPTPNTLRYLASHDGGIGNTVTIPNAGGASPDLQTDNLNRAAWLSGAGGNPAPSPLAKLINANRTGLGSIVAGAMTQAEARALFSSDDPAQAVLVSILVPRARIVITPRLNPAGLVWVVDVNVDGSQNPVIVVSTNISGVASCYVDFMFRYTDEL